jgi:hypothetical protein
MWDPSRKRGIGLSSLGIFGLDWRRYQAEIAKKRPKMGQKRGFMVTV